MSFSVSFGLLSQNLLLDLLEETLFGVVAQVELFAKLLHELEWLVVFEHFDLFNVFAIQFNLQHADGLFWSWREVWWLLLLLLPGMLLLVSGVSDLLLLVGAEGVVDHGWLHSVVLCVWSSIFVICRTSARRAIELLRCVGLPLGLSGMELRLSSCCWYLSLLSCLGWSLKFIFSPFCFPILLEVLRLWRLEAFVLWLEKGLRLNWLMLHTS